MRVWGIAAVVVCLAGALWLVPERRGVTVTFLNVGQGDAILIRGPQGAEVLIDGGATSGVVRELGRAMPFWDRSLDAIIATHPDQDHIGGLPHILRTYTVANIFESGMESDTRAWEAFDTAARAEEGATRVSVRRGDRIELGGDAYAEVLHPTGSSERDTNAASVVVRVVYGDVAVLLTGDAPERVERALLARYGSALKSTVLKAGHHGSKTSSAPEFVSAVDPEFAVFSRGCENRYGHPNKKVVQLFASLHIRTFDTCENGTITFSADRQTVRVVKSR